MRLWLQLIAVYSLPAHFKKFLCSHFTYFLIVLARIRVPVLFWQRQLFFPFLVADDTNWKKMVMEKGTFQKRWSAVEFDLVTSSFSKSSVFRCSHEDTKTVFSKLSTLESVFESCVFGDHFHRIRVGERPKLRFKRRRIHGRDLWIWKHKTDH